MESFLSFLGDGVEAGKLSVLQVLLRAVVVFFATLVIVRLGNKRFLAKRTAFDFVLALILASMMARAINGSERIGPTIAGGALLVGLHWFLGKLTCWVPSLGELVKGTVETVVEHGRVDEKALSRHHLTIDDLHESLRLKGVEELAKVKLARLERSGDVSVIRES